MTEQKTQQVCFARKNIRLPRDCYKAGDAFFITLCSENKPPILIEEPVRTVISKLLQSQMVEIGGPVQAYVLMPDHIHILLSTEKDVVQWVAWFKARVTFFAKKAGIIQKLLQGSFHDHGVRALEKVEEILRYMRENPVKAGIVERPEDWLWKEGC